MADDKIVKLPVPASPQDKDADEHARTETQRNQRLFDWADAVLKRLGLNKAVAGAKSIEELRNITFDADSAEVALAIRDALHPASGERAEYFRGLREGSVKQILKNRFAELKKTRGAELRRGRGKQSDWVDDLIVDEEGRIRPLLANLILILRKGPEWKDVLLYDEFAARAVIRKRPPLEGAVSNAAWTDHYEALTRTWFQNRGINPTIGDVGRAVQAAAKHNSFHPLQDRLEALVWDGTPRLETWPQEFLRAEDTPYVRAVASRFLISAVARIYQPGCQADHMLVLEGPQGRLKSTLLRTLALRDEWFADRLSNVATKDASIETAGVWLIEISELEGLIGVAPSAQKAFISRRHDRYRPPHGKHTISRPRQCVFVGSINPPGDGRYLRDPTGARRFWPIVCVGRIDIAGFARVRDQLWAEAVFRYKAGAPWWLETEALEALATAEQEKRYAADPWEEPIREWLGDRSDVIIWDVLQHALDLDRKQQEMQSNQKRVVNILTRLGFTQRRLRTPEGRREYRYQRDPPLKKVTD